ncbi:uroporphyrinogen-III synthase [Altererythrobacter lutimaris]|uniref:Uroporphyrinogen-III synthase n=1 Tax=Altererythrobacter lutimaris TaxID=2743979 RepID=A0A850H313_9SPHN|nr:uroporphyrinogen-III synthase [Altererythrobacter lutimaris]NVE93524.1 uroporphyrinogen-III synthase [Altererythrobacter lutimaris]
MSQVPVIAIRPEPGLSATVKSGRAIGLRISGYPLFEIQPVGWDAPDPNAFDALLVGSANVFRHGGYHLAGLRSLPVLAVGKTTATAAKEAGFSVQAIGSGGLQWLIDAHGSEPAHWLRLAGEEHVPLQLPDNLKLTTRIVYRVEATEIPAEMAARLESDCIILLHSAAAARHLVEQCNAHDIDRANVALAALGPRIIEDLGEGWMRVECAESPNEDALLALAKNMCETI